MPFQGVGLDRDGVDTVFLEWFSRCSAIGKELVKTCMRRGEWFFLKDAEDQTVAFAFMYGYLAKSVKMDQNLIESDK